MLSLCSMVRALHSFLIILVYTELITGILGNGFITLVNCIDWLKKWKISSADQILTALAISKICLIWVVMMSCFSKEFHLSSYINRMEIIPISIVGVCASYFSNWFATSLSLFYLFKITNFLNSVFLHLKHRVEMVVLVMLLGALAFLPLNIIMVNMHINMQIHSYERNMTLSSKQSNKEIFSKLIVFTTGSFVPFSISLKFFILLIFSLWKHLKNMKHSATGFRDPIVKAHIRAMKSVIFFLLLSVVYFLIAVFHSEMMIQDELVFLLSQAIANVYPSVHSFILILGNDKLRKFSHLVLWQLKSIESWKTLRFLDHYGKHHTYSRRKKVKFLYGI